MNTKSINKKAHKFCTFCSKIPIAMRITLLFLFKKSHNYMTFCLENSNLSLSATVTINSEFVGFALSISTL